MPNVVVLGTEHILPFHSRSSNNNFVPTPTHTKSNINWGKKKSYKVQKQRREHKKWKSIKLVKITRQGIWWVFKYWNDWLMLSLIGVWKGVKAQGERDI